MLISVDKEPSGQRARKNAAEEAEDKEKPRSQPDKKDQLGVAKHRHYGPSIRMR